MCEKVLNINLEAFGTSEPPDIVIRDLEQSVEHSSRSYVKETSVRFYAGAPLISPAGAIVGALSIFDDVSRPEGLSKAHRHSLHDIARSVMDYLHTYTIKDQLWRGERFTRGLISFSEGAETLLPFKNARQRESQRPQEHGITSTALESPHDERNDPFAARVQPPSTRPVLSRTKTAQQRATENLQDTILPSNARTMFSRAASVMMASSDLDGVIILDASVAANRNRRRSGSQEGHRNRRDRRTIPFIILVK
jgi:hypothetical protein